MKFDEFSSSYRQIHNKNICISGETTEYFSEYKVRVLQNFYRKHQLKSDIVFLDFGCGIGKTEQFFPSYFPHARIYSIDPSPASVRMASRSVGAASFLVFNGKDLPFRENSFDAILLACVLHHIPPEERYPVLNSALALLKPNGLLFVFEHNPFNPLTRHAVNTCPFDEDAQLLSRRNCLVLLRSLSLSISDSGYIVFFPAFLKSLRKLEAYIGWLPLGAQYFIAAKKNGLNN